MPRATGPALRQKILEEAIGIVYREGVDRITMRALAHKLGYSPATIYLYFRNKLELTSEIAAHGFQQLNQRMQPTEAFEDPLDAIYEAARIYIDFAVENGELYRLMFQEFPDDVATQAGAGDEWGRGPAQGELWSRSHGYYKRAVDSGLLRIKDPEFARVFGWTALHGFSLLVLSGMMPTAEDRAAGVSVAQVRDRLIDEWIEGMKA